MEIQVVKPRALNRSTGPLWIGSHNVNPAYPEIYPVDQNRLDFLSPPMAGAVPVRQNK